MTEGNVEVYLDKKGRTIIDITPILESVTADGNSR